MKSDLITKIFNGNKINRLLWKDEICWSGSNIAEVFGYIQTSRAVQDCIRAENLKEGKHYKTLSGEELREWIASDLMATLRQRGYYVIDGVELPTENIQKSELVHSIYGFDKFSTEKWNIME